MSEPEVYVEGFSLEACGVTGSDVAAAALAALATAGPGEPAGCEISVTGISDEEITVLNRRWFDVDGPTDVIAFALGAEPIVGDVYVSIERARVQAAHERIPLREEVLRLVVHGVLHVLGHDHPDGPERVESEMFTLQEDVLGRLLEEASGS